ncbi:benzaldehyde dehydrogenase [Acidocella aminolytica]|uniref:Aldehyde/benzaldehyde dehydrogenase NAD(P) dependent n=1 Tax=Acidocella aminolytica 101 = DSM 11237 TaxID=1120923 RepID=A0A0D6PFB4_9PROT|nr:benzaldehyde dehydrogenase [Acidocella aminolytica]GAN80357.1 aldehyde/benzaldehyde dehydrogenase NAD(P) dependent [Acidocella aminolytica 101 = DSM 11237]GBQ42922.1 NAD-dependent aldehyde dehydrogenase [Acidocella aminolytica 101 = DSM 11237]SHE29429.1 benzaldehyde dehydrogenase (NAD+) [Acidocella aminolytica 101 = DSM 11237]
MALKNSTPLLDTTLWHEKLFTGIWRKGNLSPSTVAEPATGSSLGQIGMADPTLIAESTRQARLNQVEWAALPYEERAAVLRKAARLAEEYAGEITEWLVRESGSVRAKASFEVAVSTKVLHESSALPSKSAGEVLPSVPGRLSLARRRPLGVVGVIAPFNFPLYLAIRAVAPALALGNAVVLKPDPRTAVCGGFSIARLFELAGLPAGLLYVLPGDGAAGAALTADPNVAMIAFTGSTGAGRKVGEAAGRHLKKVSLELGGKNSLIVLDDADLDRALACATWGIYLHQGQICMATGRLLVQSSIYPRLLERLVAKAKSLRIGDPATEEVDLGPLINVQQRDHAYQLVRAAQAAGAKLETGGHYRELFFEPTVLSGVGPDNPAFREEIFGPVAVVTSFDTDEEAIHLANDSEYGLSMAVISSDVGRALKLGERLHTGILHINDQTVDDEVINPFGGVGASGNGSSVGGPANWEEFTQWQWLTLKSDAPIYPL